VYINKAKIRIIHKNQTSLLPTKLLIRELSVKEKQNQFGNRTQCDEFGRYYSTDMLLVAHAIEKNVLQIINIAKQNRFVNCQQKHKLLEFCNLRKDVAD
jgi:hypothetical protein